MVNAYENATRIQMNIRLKAPIIIVPVDSLTNECICLDMGYFSITNNNTELEATVIFKCLYFQNYKINVD